MNLTSRERLLRIFRNKEVDRPALKLWGAELHTTNFLHPMYQPVAKLAAETSDLFGGASFDFNFHAGKHIDRYREVYRTDTKNPDWKDQHTIFHTPKGDLHSIDRISVKNEPHYIVEHMVKEPEDIDKLLSMEYEPFTLSRDAYDTAVSQMGERGVVMIGVRHAPYAVQTLMGSETLAYFSIDEREKQQHLIQVYADRALAHAKAILALGIQEPIFSTVGPELFLPPLMSANDFEEFVHDIDKPIWDEVHNAGGHVWVHSHGKVANFIDSFIDMGVDVLNPLEPPKNGDIDMNAIVARYGNRIGWEGNIEIQEILRSSKERLAALIDECVAAGSKSGRFILCPSSGYMEYPFPTEQYMDNLIFYLKHGLEAVERCR